MHGARRHLVRGRRSAGRKPMELGRAPPEATGAICAVRKEFGPKPTRQRRRALGGLFANRYRGRQGLSRGLRARREPVGD